MNIKHILKASSKTFKTHTPQILVGAGVAGLVVTIPLTFRAALVLDEISRDTYDMPIMDAFRSMLNKNDECIGYVEGLKTFGPPLIPVAVTAGLSSAAVIGSNLISTNRATVLAGAYAVSDRMLEEYRAQVVKKVGADEEREIHEAVGVERLRNTPLSENVIHHTEYGNTLCFDSLSGRYFRSDVESIRKAMNDLNQELFNDTFVSLNRLYDYMGLEHIRLGEELGWTTDDLVELSFSSQLSPENAPCVVVNYIVEPKFDSYRSI